LITRLASIRPLTGLLSTLLVAGCTDAPIPVTSQASVPVTELADFRKSELQAPPDAPPESANLADSHLQALSAADVIVAVMGTPPPEDMNVSAQASGKFSEQGIDESLFLLTHGLPYASGSKDAKPVSSMIALFRSSTNANAKLQLHTQFVPRGDYRSIAAVADANADGLDDVLLARYDYRMGVLTVSADLFSFADGKRELLSEFAGVYINSCESSIGERQVVAQRLSYEESENQTTEGTAQDEEEVAILIETFIENCPTTELN